MKIQSKKILIDFELEQFGRELHVDVNARTYAEGEGAFKEDTFTDQLLDLLSESGDTEGPLLCNYSNLTEKGNLDVKINGYAIRENYETLDLFVTSYRDTDAIYSLTKAETERLINSVSKFASASLKSHLDLIDPSQPAYKLALDISKHFKSFDRINLFILTNGSVPFDIPRESNIKGMDEIAVIVHVWDIERIFRLAKSKTGREAIEIDFEKLFGITIPCLKMPDSGDMYECYLAIVPGKVLSVLYHNFSTRLLESNVRAFLQQAVTVNKGIRDTIVNKPSMFLAYNNGLAVTAQDVTTKTVNGILNIVGIKDLQIVNGGQTTASLFHTEKRSKADLSNVFVQMKLTVIHDEELKAKEVPYISKYANSQNKVSELDLTSNHPYLRRLEELSRTTYAMDPENHNNQTLWFFERVKGQYKEMINKEKKKSNQEAFKIKYPPKQVFSKSEVAKYLNIWNCLPYEVSKGAQKNYTVFLEGVKKEFAGGIPGKTYFQDLVSNAILFMETDSLFGRKDKNPIGDTNLKSFTVAYTLSYFHFRTENKLNLKLIWEQQKVPAKILQLLHTIMKKVYQFLTKTGGLTSESAKDKKTWDSLKEMDIKVEFASLDKFMLSDREIKNRYSDDLDTVKESRYYQCIQRIQEAGVRFWDALPIWLLNKNEFSASKNSFAEAIKKKLKSNGVLSEIEAKHGVEILDMIENGGYSVDNIKAHSKIKEDSIIGANAIYNRISNINEDNWKRIVALGEQKNLLDPNEVFVVKSVMRKIKNKETIDIKTLESTCIVLDKMGRFGIKV